MKIRSILLCASALLAVSCNTGNETPDPAPSTATSDVASTADEDAIRDLVARWHELIEARDAAAIARLYTEDGAVMPPNAPIAVGHAAVEQTWAALMAMPGFALAIVPEEIVVSASGDMALDRGTYRLTVSPDGTEQVDTGKYVVVWRNIDGEWRAAADIFNSDLPAG